MKIEEVKERIQSLMDADEENIQRSLTESDMWRKKLEDCGDPDGCISIAKEIKRVENEISRKQWHKLGLDKTLKLVNKIE